MNVLNVQNKPVGSRSWGGWWSFHRRRRHCRCVSGRWAHNPPHPLRSECSLGARSVCLQKFKDTYYTLFYNLDQVVWVVHYASDNSTTLTNWSTKSNSRGIILQGLHFTQNFSLLVWLTGHDKTLAAWINTWKLLVLSSVILSKKHKRTWMPWASGALYRKPEACQESLAADCFPGRWTSRRTMTFVCPPKSRSEKCRGSQQELMRCNWWANEPLSQTKQRW